MQLTLGPVLFAWERPQLLDFYAEISSQPLDVIYLGETVCSKRRALSLDDWLGLARDLREACKAKIVLSGLTLLEAASELSSLRRLCDNGELMVEANDLGAVQFLAAKGVGFVGGAALNIYNGLALAELTACGLQRWVPPVECSAELIRQVRLEGVEQSLVVLVLHHAHHPDQWAEGERVLQSGPDSLGAVRVVRGVEQDRGAAPDDLEATGRAVSAQAI